jgi:hypothetical protein
LQAGTCCCRFAWVQASENRWEGRNCACWMKELPVWWVNIVLYFVRFLALSPSCDFFREHRPNATAPFLCSSVLGLGWFVFGVGQSAFEQGWTGLIYSTLRWGYRALTYLLVCLSQDRQGGGLIYREEGRLWADHSDQAIRPKPDGPPSFLAGTYLFFLCK